MKRTERYSLSVWFKITNPSGKYWIAKKYFFPLLRSAAFIDWNRYANANEKWEQTTFKAVRSKTIYHCEENSKRIFQSDKHFYKYLSVCRCRFYGVAKCRKMHINEKGWCLKPTKQILLFCTSFASRYTYVRTLSTDTGEFCSYLEYSVGFVGKDKAAVKHI